jgi:transposase
MPQTVVGDYEGEPLPAGGNRRLNHCLHIMAITQLSHDTPGRAYYQGKRAAGKAIEKRCAV